MVQAVRTLLTQVEGLRMSLELQRQTNAISPWDNIRLNIIEDYREMAESDEPTQEDELHRKIRLGE